VGAWGTSPRDLMETLHEYEAGAPPAPRKMRSGAPLLRNGVGPPRCEAATWLSTNSLAGIKAVYYTVYTVPRQLVR